MRSYGFTIAAAAHPTKAELKACKPFQHVEIRLLPKYLNDRTVKSRARKYIYNHGMIPTIKAPHSIKYGSVPYIPQTLDWARYLDAEIVSIVSSQSLDDRFVNGNHHGIQLLVENSYYLYKPRKIRDYINKHNLEGMTFVPEKFSKFNTDLSSVFREFRLLVKYAHMANRIDAGRAHRPLGDGVITREEWKNLFLTMMRADFKGTIVFCPREQNYSRRQKFLESLAYFNDIMHEIYS